MLADFCWGDPAKRWMEGQFDRYALVDPDDPNRRLKTSHHHGLRNVLHLDNSVFVHHLFTNKRDK